MHSEYSLIITMMSVNNTSMSIWRVSRVSKFLVASFHVIAKQMKNVFCEMEKSPKEMHESIE